MGEDIEQDSEALSDKEFMEALNSLAPLQQYWLLAKAKVLSHGGPYSSEELLSEAIGRTLDTKTRKRHAPRNVQVTTYLFNAMRSIAGHDRKKAARNVDSGTLEETVDSDQELENTEYLTILEKGVLLDQIFGHISDKFGGNSITIKILNCYREDWERLDVCELLEITPQEYDAAMKRIRRELSRKFSGDNK